MAVEKARHLNFYKEMLNSGNHNNNLIQIGNNLYNNCNTTNSLPVAGAPVHPAKEDLNKPFHFPFYNFNDVVLHSGAGKLPPAVKDDSSVTFNNSTVSPPVPRKRAREQLISQSAMVSRGATSMIAPTGCIVSKESNGFSFLGEDLSLQIMQQQLQLDRLISQHMVKIRIELVERKKQQLRRIMAAIEEALAKKLQDKEEEIKKITKINWALEEKVKSLHLENQIWKDMAQTSEATAIALRTKLDQVLQNAECPSATKELMDDAVSCCGSSGKNDEFTAVKNEGVSGENGGKRLCKKCGEDESRVLVLPCRHLCLCTTCGPAVNSCPVCKSVKNASVHVNLSSSM